MLDRIHEAAIPYELDPEALERIDQHLARVRADRAATRAAEPHGEYGPENRRR
jgi:S-adenosylmethionine:diacylglycerol 3-amino-3-carboxypropyl transferase